MSKAFLRESDFADLPPLRTPVALLPAGMKNYLTPEGANRLRAELDELLKAVRPSLVLRSRADDETKRELQVVDQRIRYLQASLQSAAVVEPTNEEDDVVRFGTSVTVRNEQGDESRYRLVGVDETDLERGWISWMSPLARALLNARHGSTVEFTSPAGTVRLTVVAVSQK